MRKRWIRGLAFFAMGAGAILLGTSRLLAAELDPVLLSPDLWKLDRPAFEAQVSDMGFRWVSAAKDSLRSVSPALTFEKERVFEAVVRFGSNCVSEAMLSLYNRGDAGDISGQDFEQRVAGVCERMEEMAGAKGREIASRQPVRADRKVKWLRWEKAPSVYVLEWAYSRPKGVNEIRPEFMNLTISPSGVQSSRPSAGAQKVDVGTFDLRKRIKRTPNGDVWLDNVPMVDQGQKGYCAVAATERVMRYYGVDVNQHELAQKASTASGGGTDPASLIKALKSMTNVLGVRIKTLQDFEVKDFLETMRSYNREAKRRGKVEIMLPMGGVIDTGEVFAEMDKTTYVSMRVRNGAQVDRFGKMVKEKLNAGYPVLWGVMLGMVDETPQLPQAQGGHLRLIIGYNSRTSEILYSDTWGAGHELKRMSQAKAYAITMALHTIELR